MSKNENLNPIKQEEERSNENVLRPSYLRDFLGQEKLKENLEIFIRAARNRGDVLDHVLFYQHIHFELRQHGLLWNVLQDRTGMLRHAKTSGYLKRIKL